MTKRTLFQICYVLAVVFCVFYKPAPVLAFRFVSWSDTKSGTATLTQLSSQVAALNPVFSIYPGDVCDSGPNPACFATWQNSFNGGSTPGNGLFNKLFATRGNHDSAGTAFWVSTYDVAGTAARVGATNVSQLNTNLTYSFDFGNSHFIGADAPGGDASSISPAIFTWIDQDLTAAEGRGLTHAFIFFHGPIWYVDGHASGVPTGLISVINKHPIVSATFHGHEHVLAYVHMDSTRIPSLTHPFEEFVIGSAGAPLYSCTAGRSDYCIAQPGFATIDVNGSSFSVNIYTVGNGSPVKSYAFTKGQNPTPQATPTPTSGSAPTPTPTPRAGTTPTPTPKGGKTPTPTPTKKGSKNPTPTPTPNGNQYPTATPTTQPATPTVTIYSGDANGDGLINEADFGIWQSHLGFQQSGGPSIGDFDGNGIVDGVDYTIWLRTVTL